MTDKDDGEGKFDLFWFLVTLALVVGLSALLATLVPGM